MFLLLCVIPREISQHNSIKAVSNVIKAHLTLVIFRICLYRHFLRLTIGIMILNVVKQSLYTYDLAKNYVQLTIVTQSKR